MTGERVVREGRKLVFLFGEWFHTILNHSIRKDLIVTAYLDPPCIAFLVRFEVTLWGPFSSALTRFSTGYSD